jgi:sortase A
LRRGTSRALLLAGVLSIAAAAAILSKAWIGQVLLGVAWQRALAAGVASAPWPGADTRPVARIVAPAQSADVLVLAGATGRTLAWGPGHLDGTAPPGTPERGLKPRAFERVEPAVRCFQLDVPRGDF